VAEIPDALGEAWKNVVAQWDDTARHDELLRLVNQHEAYAWAAARYRERKDDPIAQDRLERLRKAATARLMTSATVREDKASQTYRATWAMLGILIIAIVASLVYALARGDGGDSARRITTPPPPPTTK
jgi:hypothetical protein